MLRHTAERHIIVPLPLLLVQRNERQHINGSLKHIYRIALPDPAKTVPRITAVHIPLNGSPFVQVPRLWACRATPSLS